MQSLCQNNVLGIVVNGARRGELYSKYTYYHSYILRGKTTRKKKWKKPNPKPKPETSVDEHSLTWDTDPLLTHWL